MTTETGAEQGAAEGQSATEDLDVNGAAGGEAGEAGGSEEGASGEAGAAAEGGEAGGDAGAAAGAEGEQPPPPKKKSAAIQARFDDLTREKYDAERRAEAAETELRRLKGGGADSQAGTSGDGGGPAMVPVDKVYEVADQIAEVKKFNQRCDDAYDAGEKEFGEDFAEGMKQLQIAGAVKPENLGLVHAALDTDAPAAVLHHLGQDPDEAVRLSKLPPIKLGMEVAKLAAKLSAPKPAPAVSKAPAPITPVGGSARPDNDIYDPKLSDDEYYARRAKSGAKFVPGSR